MLKFNEMLDRLLVTIAAKIRLKKYLWPSHKDPNFFKKIDSWQKSANIAPKKRYLRGVTLKVHDINGYACYQISKNKSTSSKRIFYIHGGAFVFPVLQAHWRFVTFLVRQSGYTAIVPLYPLVPRHTYKDIHSHLKTVYLRMFKNEDPHDIFLIGDSAGGNLALVLPLILPKQMSPKNIIVLSPVVDLSASNPEMEIIEPQDPLLPLETIRYLLPSYYKGLDVKNPIISPIFADYRYCGSRLSIFNGGKDILSPEITLFHQKLLDSRIDHEYVFNEYLPHAWPLLPLFAARDSRAKIVDLLLTS